MTAPVAVRERGILMSAPMVRAILDGRKTQTRRVVKTRFDLDALLTAGTTWKVVEGGLHYDDGVGRGGIPLTNPYGLVGDRLWVRESFAGPDHIGNGDQGVGFGIEYKADGAFRAHGDCGCDGPCGGVLIVHPWKPSIHMPRWASRITLEITDVRVERVQDISEDDAQAEGVECPQCADQNWREVGGEAVQCDYPNCGSGRALFRDLWDTLNAKRGYGWDANPWVWVLEFRRLA